MTKDQLIIERFYNLGSDRTETENSLLNAGVPLPLMHRSVWCSRFPSHRSWFIGVRRSEGNYLCGFAIDLDNSRALPGHRLLRVERFGPAASNEARQAGLLALTKCAREQPRILRLNLEVFSPSQNVRDSIAQTVVQLGFRRRNPPRLYTETVIVDLNPSEDTIFGSLHPTARRHIRAIAKHPVRLQPVTDRMYAPRLASLQSETMARTGGHHIRRDWPAIIDLSAHHPELSHIAGLFHTQEQGPDRLLAFVWGRFHGDHADYAVAASTRLTSLKMPLGYALAWDLICWAKNSGATWFDFGGITEGTLALGGRLGGISDFKRYFTRRVVTVGEEWVLEPNPLRARFAHTISMMANRARNVVQ